MLNMGTEFIWWMGVVEDRGDPLQLGRVRDIAVVVLEIPCEPVFTSMICE